VEDEKKSKLDNDLENEVQQKLRQDMKKVDHKTRAAEIKEKDTDEGESMTSINRSDKVCPKCDLELKKVEQGQGAKPVILVVVGILTSFLIIGIPILIYGMMLMMKKETFMMCDKCGYRREIKWSD